MEMSTTIIHERIVPVRFEGMRSLIEELENLTRQQLFMVMNGPCPKNC
jgi:hypothetical protein